MSNDHLSFKMIPYYEPRKNLKEAINKSSTRRGRNPLKFFFKKIWSNFLQWNAYFCPVNSWRVRFHRWRGVNIGKNVFIGFQCTLDHAYPEYIYIQDNASLAGDVYVLCHSNPYKHFKGVLLSYVAPVIIKEGAWLGVRSTVLPGVTIGEKSVISASSVVTKNIPDHVIAQGNPAEVIKKIKR